jgi:hypothetical protein
MTRMTLVWAYMMLPSSSAYLLKNQSFARGAVVGVEQFEARSATHARLLDVLRTALKMTEKTVNELAYSIQRNVILIVCQSAEVKYL